jgi:hypothetical protein
VSLKPFSILISLTETTIRMSVCVKSALTSTNTWSLARRSWQSLQRRKDVSVFEVLLCLTLNFQVKLLLLNRYDPCDLNKIRVY